MTSSHLRPPRPPRRERAATWLAGVIGSWAFLLVAAIVLEGALVVAVRQDRVDGAVAVLGTVVTGLVLLDLSVLLMAVRRADRVAEELAMHHLEESVRTKVEAAELRGELARLSVEVARLNARLRAGQR